jgi:hypothetical protein
MFLFLAALLLHLKTTMETLALWEATEAGCKIAQSL